MTPEQKAHKKAYMKEYYQRYKLTHKDTRRRDRHGYMLKYKFRIKTEPYNLMFAEQGGCCKICGKHQSNFKKRLHVDHDHETGVIRGLLCHHCNFGLGHFKDNEDFLFNAIAYLRGDNFENIET